MKPFERIPFLANVLTAVCKRPAAEVGKLVKAVVAYVTEGTRTDLDDLRIQAYYDLLVQDIDSMRAAADTKSKKCSESAKCRAVRNASSPVIPVKKANAANATTAKPKAIIETAIASSTADAANDADISDESEQYNDGIHSTESGNATSIDGFNASDVNPIENVKPESLIRTTIFVIDFIAAWSQVFCN